MVRDSVYSLHMKDKIVTITSKNQITLPAEYVRKLKLAKNRTLTARLKGDGLELKPQPTLEERMKKHWEWFKKTHPNHKPLTDEELKQEIKQSVAEAWSQQEAEGRHGGR